MDRTSRVAMLLSVLAMAVAGFVWFTSNQQIEMLRASQRDLMTEVSAMRRTPLIDITGAPTLGAPDAVVTLIEFSDYECPFCIRHFEQTWPQINENFVKTGKIRYVFRDFPVDQLHPDAIRAHEAAQCACSRCARPCWTDSGK